jgi:hypothetical protein
LVFHVLGFRVQAADLSRPLWVAALLAAFIVLLSRRRWLQWASAAGAGLCLCLALLMIARRADATPPIGDVGVIEVYLFNAIKGRLLLGPYSRFLWHHPGPVYFFALSPFYALSGYKTTGAAAGALAINIGAVALIAWTARRAGGRRASVALTASCALYAARFGALFTSQWNPHMTVLPTMAFVVVAAAVAAGHIGFIPALFALATFTSQTHVGLVPIVGALGAAALVPLLAGPWALAGGERRRLWWYVNAGLWLAAFLWLPPIVEEITGNPGNLTRLWRFFVSGGNAGQSVTTALAAWSGAFAGVIRTGFAVAWGGALPPEASVAGVIASATTLLLLAMAAVRAAKAGRRFQAALSGLLILGAGVSWWSVTRIAGEIVDHEVFWISGLGALAIGVLAHAIAEAGLTSSRLDRVGSGPAPDAVCLALVAFVVWLGARDLSRLVDQASRPGDQETAAITLSDEIIKYARAERVPKVLVDIDGPAWGVAAGVLVELARADVQFSVAPSAVWMFGDASAPDGSETRRILISRYAGHQDVHQKAGTVSIAERRGFFADVVTQP